jgi:sugar lactone lactonase YvrE
MRLPFVIVLFSCALVLAGCAGMPAITTSNTDSIPGTVLHGSVHGGQNPIIGAHVYLYAINTNGYGGPGIAASSTNASVSLLGNDAGTTQDANSHYYVTTDQYGNFTITGDYSCPSNYAHTFFYASGGDPGLGSGVNSAITLTAPAQACNTSASTDINEVSTIATAYAFAGYASDPTHISTSNTVLAATGLTNAANTLANLETANTGVALATTAGGNGTVPQTEINTLANILAACVNSTGPTSTQCGTLFSNATNNGVDAPDTATAALNIAHNPGPSSTVVGNLFGLQTPSSPFQPMLPSAPNDFTIAISYSGGGLNSPVPLAIDAAGDVWVGNTASGANSVSEFSPLGAVISGSPFSGGGIVDPYSIAIDKSGNLWTANVTPNSLSELSSAGAPVSTSAGYTGGGLNAPYDIALDSLGHVWVVNNVGSSLSEFTSAGANPGTPLTTSPGDQGGGISNDPVSLAIDASGNIWISDSITLGALSEFYATGASSGTAESGTNGDTGGGLNDPWGLAVDGSGNVWVADSGTGANRISLFGASGTAISSPTGYIGGGLNIPEGIAIDGAGNVWVANRATTLTSPPYPNSDISEFNSAGTAISSSTGYQAGLNLNLRIAVDGSGNIWVTNASLNSITEFVGAGSPVVTPKVANLLNPYGSRAVNKP